jgi:transposase
VALTFRAEAGEVVTRIARTIRLAAQTPCPKHRRQGSITKVGNAPVRRLLVEAGWHARRRPKVGYELARRQRGQDAVVVERAWRCQQRLHQR